MAPVPTVCDRRVYVPGAKVDCCQSLTVQNILSKVLALTNKFALINYIA